MSYIVARTCVEIKEASPVPYRSGSRPIAEFRDAAVYVLLGDPGMGKTTTLKEEARLAGGYYITARQFTRREIRPEVAAASTLYIDELDEIRLRSTDELQILDDIFAKLRRLGLPRVRIACRPAHWYGALDRELLEAEYQHRKARILLLDPLSDADIRVLLTQNHGIEDIDSFLRATEAAGSSGLAANPLNVTLMAEMFARGEIPGSRKQLWDRKCTQLLEECNVALGVARKDEPSAKRLVERAEYLCACLLLSGSRGYTLVGKAAPGFPRLRDLPADDVPILRRILDSRLFKANSEGRMVPVLRPVCESLAVRHVASLLRKRLSLQRVLALVADDGGRLLPEFAGFVAWLSEHCTANREELIQRGPAEILALAETQSFAPAEKLQLLKGVVEEVLERRTPLAQILVGPHLGGLATLDMEEHIVRVLRHNERGERQAIAVSILAEALSRSDAASRAAGPLLQVVRDTAWQLPVRLRALEAALRRYGKSESPTGSELAELASEFEGRPQSDDKDAILGRLLPRLYPEKLTPSAMVQYLHTPCLTPDTSYIRFWAGHVQAQSSAAHLPELLNALVARVGEVQRYDRRLANTIREVLLITLGNHLPLLALRTNRKQLAAWLCSASYALNSRTYEFGVFQSEAKVRAFLHTHSSLREELAQLGDCTVALGLLFGTPESLHEQGTPVAGLELLPNAPGNMPGDSRASDPNSPPDLLVRRALADEEQCSVQAVSALTEVGEKVQLELQRNDRMPLHLDSETLTRLSETYLGLGRQAEGLASTMRLGRLLGGDNDLLVRVLHEIRTFALTADIPEVSLTLRLLRINRAPAQVLPFMAGTLELYRSAPEHAFWSDEERLRRVVAVYLCARRHLLRGPGSTPIWFADLCSRRPDMIASVFVPFVVASWTSNSKLSPSGLTEILYLPAYEPVARKCVLPLLRKLPVRGGEEYSLMHLLQGALRFCTPKQVVELAKAKLAAKSMAATQRVYWLTAGLFADSNRFVTRLEEFVAGDQLRVSLLVKAVGLFKSAGTERLSTAALAAVVRLIGTFYDPKSFGNRSAPARKSAADCVRGPLDALQSIPGSQARDALSSLARNDALSAWRSEILTAAKRQQSLSQRLSYRYASVQEVAQVLSNADPASAADLAALTVAELRDLAVQIRHGSTSDWRQFWNVDRYNRPERPKPENAGRDIIASSLATRMEGRGVSVHCEAAHANDTRTDIQVSGAGFRIPVEVKRSCHGELWSALESQLIAKYCADPDSEGYGIYLVLWYGDAPTNCRRPARNGTAVGSASELETLLEDSIPDDHKHRVTVVVMDVACVV